MLKKSTQVSFLEARPTRDTNLARLCKPTSLIKYITLYQNLGTTCVLAQGETKFTLKKWMQILSAATVQPVANMCSRVASATCSWRGSRNTGLTASSVSTQVQSPARKGTARNLSVFHQCRSPASRW